MDKRRNKTGRWIAAVLAALGLGFVFYQMAVDNMPKGTPRQIDGYIPWSKDILLAAAAIPLQEGGRIKPLSTYAGFTMLSLHGGRSMKLLTGEDEEIRLKPTAWLLDALFRPQYAIKQPTFRVDNSAALEAIGVKPRGKRDTYSYEELEPGRTKLGELVEIYQKIDSKQRDVVQTQILDLASNMRTYEFLLGYFSFARTGVILRGSGENGGPDKHADMSAMMATAPQLRKQMEHSRDHSGQMEPRLTDLLNQVLNASNYAKFGLFLIPAKDPENETWNSAGNAIMNVMSGSDADPQTAIEDIKTLETLARSVDKDPAEFQQNLVLVKDRFTARALERDEGKSIGLEAAYYQKNWFLFALIFFLLGTLTAFGMWFAGQSLFGRICYWACVASTTVGVTYCTIAIVKRCVIMQRPPIGNLYDTIIFIATTGVMLCLLVEWFMKRRFALGLAPILGTALIVLARRFELGDAKDHMDPLVAVLDSNFWLTIHVINITLGYSAGLLSAFLSTGYILMRGLDLDEGDASLRRSLTRAVYGMLCVTLFFSLVGTVLGGIWANYSWGRFWGWDPKENGALLIVLWTLSILHARLGGYIREWGIHLASIFTAIVVTFSWWHVNFLGTGLHNYGFTAGKDTIWFFYATMTAVLIFGFICRAFEQAAKPKGIVRES
jgi:ABC-type transport system involved in cytochrome c biogenesis permease subunit